ncbi:MAG: pyridoxal 5'-phosphate synthase glutaminase subunit PdxT [Lachnospiraceae bacterium]|nr:pyridoxal 5'-phosphate synthase glutaminase subunit PdxT [Lachnospiraceae bacterium]MDE6625085.1 pyridoxal 5'-phosphate synthase glutaminase subunit PdxT [Lachnospiraceae bacterium]
MTVAVLAVQGAFIEHKKVMQSLGVDCVELRKAKDLQRNYDGLILPGGESTVQGKLLRELDMFDILQKQIEAGLPTFATCAGLILLAEEISNGQNRYFQTMPVTVKRNAYGRQLGSFHSDSDITGIGTYPMEFIRAPYIERVGTGVEVLAVVEGHVVGVRYKNQTGFAFHPELTNDTRLHKEFINSIHGA